MTDSTADDDTRDPGRPVGSALLSFGLLAYVAVYFFDQVPLALAVGALAALGTLLSVPYKRRRRGDYALELGTSTGRRLHPGAAGYALSVSAFAALGAMFALDDAVRAVLGAVAVALAGYLLLSRVLPRAGETATASE